ncbi:hypothetical protein ACEPAI_1913 [Sanghuangporus weigelae]
MEVIVGCLLIDRKKKPTLGNPFPVILSPNASIYNLLEKVKIERTTLLKDVDTVMLTVWRSMEPKLLKTVTLTQLKEDWSKVDFADKTKAVQLGPLQEIATLSISDEILLIEVPNSGDTVPAANQFSQLVKDSAITMLSDTFQLSDIEPNNIGLADSDDEVNIKHYRKVLDMRRKVPPDLEKSVKAVCEARVPDDESSDLDECEVLHMLWSAKSPSAKSPKGPVGKIEDRVWTELDAHVHFCYCLSYYAQSRMTDSGKHGWPITLPIIFNGVECRYTPKSDFFLSIHGIPIIVMEVKSKGAESDKARMYLSCACLVRLVNGLLKSKGKTRDFVMMAFYLESETLIQRALFYQATDNKVKYREEKFENTSASRFQVIEGMYNVLDGMTSLWDTLKSLEGDLDSIHKAVEDKPTWTAKTKTTKTTETTRETTRETGNKRDHDDDGAPDAGAKRGKGFGNPRSGGSGGGRGGRGGGGKGSGKGSSGRGGGENATNVAMDGYEVVQWSVSERKPPNVFVVRRVKDSKTFVAKVSRRSGEKQILEYLHKKDRKGNHVIPFKSTISSNLGTMVLLPVRYPVRRLLEFGLQPSQMFTNFAEALINGVAFLHRHLVAHLDIKPDNLVYDDELRIQIIDFDVSVQLEDENDTIDYEVGTTGYAAPEVYQRDFEDPDRRLPYRPILADRYSLGVTIRKFLRWAEWSNRRNNLEDFANRLTCKFPHRRPPLDIWAKKNIVPQKRRRPRDFGQNPCPLPSRFM